MAKPNLVGSHMLQLQVTTATTRNQFVFIFILNFVAALLERSQLLYSLPIFIGDVCLKYFLYRLLTIKYNLCGKIVYVHHILNLIYCFDSR